MFWWNLKTSTGMLMLGSALICSLLIWEYWRSTVVDMSHPNWSYIGAQSYDRSRWSISLVRESLSDVIYTIKMGSSIPDDEPEADLSAVMPVIFAKQVEALAKQASVSRIRSVCLGIPLRCVLVSDMEDGVRVRREWRVSMWRVFINIICATVCVVGARSLVCAVIRNRRVAAGRCWSCGYSVRDLMRCPECGSAIRRDQERFASPSSSSS